jgi:hypothetical protein
MAAQGGDEGGEGGEGGGEGGGRGGGLGGGAIRVPVQNLASPGVDEDRAGGNVYQTPQQLPVRPAGPGAVGEGKADVGDDDCNGAPMMKKSGGKGQKIGKVFAMGAWKAIVEEYFNPPKGLMEFGRNLTILARQLLEEFTANTPMWISVCEGVVESGMP